MKLQTPGAGHRPKRRKDLPAPDVLDRIRRRILAFLSGPGAGRPRSRAEIGSFGNVDWIVHAVELDFLLEGMVARGELVAADDVVAGTTKESQRPFRGYALPTAETGGAA